MLPYLTIAFMFREGVAITRIGLQKSAFAEPNEGAYQGQSLFRYFACLLP